MTAPLDTAGLTPKQAKALRFITERIAGCGISPSFEELRDAMGVRSRSTVSRCLRSLRDRGRIIFRESLPRSIRLVDARSYRLPPDLQAELEAFAASLNEDPRDVVIAALVVHLDAMQALRGQGVAL